MSTTKTITSLQAVRAFAAISVVCFHATHMIAYRMGYWFLHNFFVFGAIAIDLFFVLSGFIIYYSIASRDNLPNYKPATRKDFFTKRLTRAYPIYWVAVLAVIAMLLFENYFLHASATQSFTLDVAKQGGFGFWLNALLLTPHMPAIVAVSWTMSYEVLFYLIFGYCFFRSRKLFFTVFGIYSLFLLLNGLFFHLRSSNYALEFFLNPMFAEFYFGCVAGYCFVKRDFKFGHYFLWIGITLLICFGTIRFNTHHVMTTGVFATMVIFGAAHIQRQMPKILTYLGDASYSIYLFHYISLAVYYKLAFMLGLGWALPHVYGVAGLIIATLLTTCGIYSWIELPLHTHCLRWIKRLQAQSSIQSKQPLPAE